MSTTAQKTAKKTAISPLKAAAQKAAAKSAKKPSANKSAQAPAPKARRLEDIAQGRKGLFCIDPTLITPEPGFNKRENYGDLEQLAADIAANGLDQPLKVRKVAGTETILIVSGHRRHKAITEILIPQGRWQNPDGSVKTVDCYAEAQGTTKIDRLISQISGNTGLPYSLLEKAAVYQEILAEDPSIKPADLSRRFGETKQAVSDALRLVNHGSAALLENVRKGMIAASTAVQIIKQAGNEAADQMACLTAALEAAKAAGNGHVTPKHLPQPEKKQAASGLWSYEASAHASEFNDHDVCVDPNEITGKPGPGIESISISTATKDGKWYCGYDYQTKGGGHSGGGSGANITDDPADDEPAAIRKAWGRLCFRLKHAAKGNPQGPAMITYATKLGHDLSAMFPTGTPWDESELLADEQETSTPTSQESGDNEDEESNEGNPPAKSTFKLYVIDDVPEEPVSEGSPEYHETDRLVLLQPENFNLERLHLLCAATDKGVAYGYRINDTEMLPDVSSPYLDAPPETAFKAMIAAAVDAITGDPQVYSDLSDLLYDALCRYYPEQGAPEESEHLSFVGASDAPAKEETGYKAILNAKPTGGSGGGFGGGKTGFAAPDKQMEKINDLLEALAEKDEASEKRLTIEDRVTAVEITLGILRNERSITDLRSFLTGKA